MTAVIYFFSNILDKLSGKLQFRGPRQIPQKNLLFSFKINIQKIYTSFQCLKILLGIHFTNSKTKFSCQ